MKKYLVALSALLLSAGAARADITDNAFVSVLGGWTTHPDLSLGASHVGVNDNYNVGARVGTWLDPLPGFTLDADYFYNRADYPGHAAHLNSSSFMGDLIYHLPTPGLPVNFYGGGGLGVMNDNLSGTLHGSSVVMGWQGIAGAEFPTGNNSSFFAEYRYQNAHDANVGGVSNVGNTSDSLSFGMKFTL